MANPIIPGIPQTEQDLLYSKLNAYNQGRASYKEVGAYLVVLPRPEHLQYTLFPISSKKTCLFILFCLRFVLSLQYQSIYAAFCGIKNIRR